MDEWEGEVFKLDGMLVVKGKDGNLFSLKAQIFVGKVDAEKEERMESIGVFSVYD